MKIIKLYKSVIMDPYLNLAIEAFLYKNATEDTITLFLWQNDKTVVVGRYQNVFEEVNLEYAKQNGIQIVRRDTGGGAVYHDTGNLNYSFIFCSDDSLFFCKEVVFKVLSLIGISGYERLERNDILVGGKKISGTSCCKNGKRQLYHGTLLINSDLAMLNSVLTRNNKIVYSKSVKSNQKLVTNLSNILGKKIDIEEVIEAFSEATSAKTQKVDETLSFFAEKDSIRKLAEEKYRSELWNYGFQPKFNFRDIIHTDAGNICLNAQINKYVITNYKITGDFITKGDLSQIEDLFVGQELFQMSILTLLEQKNNEWINETTIIGISNGNLVKEMLGRLLSLSPNIG